MKAWTAKSVQSSTLGEHLASFSRSVQQAGPQQRAVVFLNICKESIRLHTVGKIPKAEILDGLRIVGRHAGLSEDKIEETLVEAVARPFRPRHARSSVPDTLKRPAKEPSIIGTAELVMRRASDITPEEIAWLWPQLIALGKLTVVAGEPGLGKSQVSYSIAAAVTTSGSWPSDGGTAPRGSVIILSSEDDAADTIRPRLDAAGADVSRVYIVSAVRDQDGKGRRSFNLQADLALLEREIDQLGDVRLVVIDPVSSYLGKIDAHKNADLRAVLEPVGEMASRLGVAVLAITHLNKGGVGSANSRVIGSIALVAAARAVFIVANDPDDPKRRLFLPSKSNLSKERTGLGFRVGERVTQSGIVAPAIDWDSEPVTMSADQVLASSHSSSGGAVAEAKKYLLDALGHGQVPQKDIETDASAEGISPAALRRAKTALGVKSAKNGVWGGWVWTLPEGEERESKMLTSAH
jgi:putative DNA primase/helicase